MSAALEHGIRRVINTGPQSTVFGLDYTQFVYLLTPDVPPHPGTDLYGLTKSLGQEICQVFSENHDLYVIELLFWGLVDPAVNPRPDGHAFGEDFVPFAVAPSAQDEILPDLVIVGASETSPRSSHGPQPHPPPSPAP